MQKYLSGRRPSSRTSRVTCAILTWYFHGRGLFLGMLCLIRLLTRSKRQVRPRLHIYFSRYRRWPTRPTAARQPSTNSPLFARAWLTTAPYSVMLVPESIRLSTVWLALPQHHERWSGGFRLSASCRRRCSTPWNSIFSSIQRGSSFRSATVSPIIASTQVV